MHPTYDNARLVDIRALGDARFLVLDCDGQERLLPTSFPIDLLHGERAWLRAGQIGRAQPEEPEKAQWESAPLYRFDAYCDQTLRRAPELDGADPDAERLGSAPCVAGWRCEARPDGFRAPLGLLPGERGEFVADATFSVSVRVPPEFVALCEEYGLTPERALRAFVADASGVDNFVRLPRADGLNSQGSDECNIAHSWFERAYGMRVEDVARRRSEAAAAQEVEDERQEHVDALEALFDEYTSADGLPDALLSQVAALVEAQEATVPILYVYPTAAGQWAGQIVCGEKPGTGVGGCEDVQAVVNAAEAAGADFRKIVWCRALSDVPGF